MFGIFNLFRKKNRKIFRYFDGVKNRCGDPIVLNHALAEHESYLVTDIQKARDGNSNAARSIAQAAVDVFGVVPIRDDGKGLTIEEAILVVVDFELFKQALKKNTTH